MNLTKNHKPKIHKTVPKLRSTGTEIQETQWAPAKTDVNRKTLRHTVIRMINSKDRHRILKAEFIYKGPLIRVMADLAIKIYKLKEDLIKTKTLNEINISSGMLYLSRLSFTLEEMI